MPLPRRVYFRICGAHAPSGVQATLHGARRRVPASRSPSSAAVHDSCGVAADCKPAALRTDGCATPRPSALGACRSWLGGTRTPQVEIERAAVEVGRPVIAVREQRGDTDAVDESRRRAVYATGHTVEARTMAG